MKIKKAKANFTIFLSGVSLVILSIVLILKPFKEELMNYRLISVVFILSALLDVLAFAQNKRWYFRPGWLLQQSFFLLFFGIILFFSANIHLSTDLLLFSFMAFFTAAAQFACSIQLHALVIKRWWWVSIFGLVNIFCGCYFLTNPFEKYINTLPSIAIYIFVTGFICVLEPLVYLSKNKKEGKLR